MQIGGLRQVQHNYPSIAVKPVIDFERSIVGLKEAELVSKGTSLNFALFPPLVMNGKHSKT